jgi:hypothetical protein
MNWEKHRATVFKTFKQLVIISLLLFTLDVGSSLRVARAQQKDPSSSVTARVLPAATAQEFSVEGQADRDNHSPANWWMVRLAFLIVLICTFQTWLFGLQARRLKHAVEKMEEIAEGQTIDMQSSIDEVSRAATAIERMVEAMTLSGESIKNSVVINREIADRQKFIMESQSRAYLQVGLENGVCQDETYVFETIASIANRGNTPAYDVTYRCATDVVPYPIPDDFVFSLRNEHSEISVSIIGPGGTKSIRSTVPNRIPDDELEAIKSANGARRLIMWGEVNYKDAFGQARYVRFAFCAYWAGVRPDGSPILTSTDIPNHNDSN